MGKDFIELTQLYDGRRIAIRAACVEAVIENGLESQGCGMVKPACVTVYYNGTKVDVTEGFDTVCGLIFNAEL